MPIDAITPPVVLSALRGVEQRGRLETARRVRQRISAVFKHAIAEGLVESDPADVVGRALMPPAPQRRQPALLDLADARALLAAAELVNAAPAIKLASRFLALTAVRLAAVRGMNWRELVGIDWGIGPWSTGGSNSCRRYGVPAARMKLAAAKKG